MIIQHNIPGLNSKRNCNKNSSKLAASLEKLSSGYDINRAADDAAGLAVSEKMRSQIAGIKRATRNCRDGISMLQIYEGALDGTSSILNRMKVLAYQAANGTYDDEIDRADIEAEFQNLCEEVDQFADTDFNGLVMLNGGRMADKFTYVTEDQTYWFAPADVDFVEGTYVTYVMKARIRPRSQ